jgi:SRSO17 transposase
MIRRSWARAASIEATLALWAASLREMKQRIRPLCRQERFLAASVPFKWIAGDTVYGVCDIEQQLRRVGKGYILGVSSAQVFHSWGKRRSVAGRAADIAQTRRSSDWKRLSAGRLAQLEKTGLVNHQDRIGIRQMLDDIVADDVAHSIFIPIPATKDRLLTPRAWIASSLRAHPTGLALLVSEQAFQK